MSNDILRQEFQTIKERYVAFLWNGGFRDQVEALKIADADEIVKSLVPGDAEGTYFWEDVDYADVNRGPWKAAQHYSRIQRTLFMGGKERFEQNTDYREKLVGALRFWLVHDFKNPNWWHNDIGMPCHMGDLGLMMWDAMNAADREKLITLLARGSMKTRQDIPRWTGANLMWGAYDTIKHALLTEDIELLRTAVDRLSEEFAFTNEGIQEDGAFYQHGPRWYSCGYGGSFTFDASQLIYLFRGTSFQFSKERLNIFLHHVLDGQRYMMLHGYADTNSLGRELTRRKALYNRGVAFAAEYLSEVEDLPRREEMLAFRKELNHAPTIDTEDGVKVTRFYPSISFLMQRYRGTYIGIKCHNAGQYDAEICNSEGELCYNMSYGSRYCLMRRGNEYFDLNPIYDWAHVPGTTARLENDEQLLAHRNWWCLPLPNDATGGLTCGNRGVIYEKPEHDGIRLLTSFFVFDGCLVALGAGICDEKENGLPLTTTLDQCLPENMAWAADGRGVSNGGFTYYNLESDSRIVADVIHREGSWKRNSFEEAYEAESGEVFLAYIPVENGKTTYAYGIAPREETLSVKVLYNTEKCQAIALADGAVMAVFHEDFSLSVGCETIEGKQGQCLIFPAIK